MTCNTKCTVGRVQKGPTTLLGFIYPQGREATFLQCRQQRKQMAVQISHNPEHEEHRIHSRQGLERKLESQADCKLSRAS